MLKLCCQELSRYDCCPKKKRQTKLLMLTCLAKDDKLLEDVGGNAIIVMRAEM